MTFYSEHHEQIDAFVADTKSVIDEGRVLVDIHDVYATAYAQYLLASSLAAAGVMPSERAVGIGIVLKLIDGLISGLESKHAEELAEVTAEKFGFDTNPEG